MGIWIHKYTVSRYIDIRRQYVRRMAVSIRLSRELDNVFVIIILNMKFTFLIVPTLLRERFLGFDFMKCFRLIVKVEILSMLDADDIMTPDDSPMRSL